MKSKYFTYKDDKVGQGKYWKEGQAGDVTKFKTHCVSFEMAEVAFWSKSRVTLPPPLGGVKTSPSISWAF